MNKKTAICLACSGGIFVIVFCVALMVGRYPMTISDFFNWTNTQIGQAIGFAQEYAKSRNGHTVFCSNSHRKSDNDDYVKCATKDGSVFYEFKFDDVRESIDEEESKRGSGVQGIQEVRQW